MSNKNKRSLAEIRILSRKYHWEFLRRNKDFKSDVDKFISSPSDSLYEKITRKTGFFPMDYNKSLEEIIRKEKKKKRALKIK